MWFTSSWREQASTHWQRRIRWRILNREKGGCHANHYHYREDPEATGDCHHDIAAGGRFWSLHTCESEGDPHARHQYHDSLRFREPHQCLTKIGRAQI